MLLIYHSTSCNSPNIRIPSFSPLCILQGKPPRHPHLRPSPLRRHGFLHRVHRTYGVETLFVPAGINLVHIYYLSDKTDWHRIRHSADVIFEVVSAAANVGISTGFVNPGMSPAAKWLFIVVMWAGRLEIVPVIALVTGAARRL